MTTSSTMLESRHHVRSIRMPSRSHPSSPRMEEELRKLKIWESSSSASKMVAVCVGLAGLGELYKCVEDLLQLPQTQQSLIHHHQNEKWVDDVLDGSVGLQDVCGTASDILSQMKENAADLKSALRRRCDESCKEEKVDAYVSLQEENERVYQQVTSPLLDQDHHHLDMVIRVLREVRAVTVSIFQYSLLAFMSDSKPTKWSLVSKLMQKGQVRCVEEHDAVECVDAALRSLSRRVSSKDAELQNVQTAQKSLEALEVSIEGVEAGFECMSRSLIQTRVSLLNVFTH